MPNVIVDKNKIDILANAISNKSGEALTLTLDEMVEAVDNIETGGGGITPTGNIDITSAGVTDVTNYATATVPQADVQGIVDNYFTTQNGQRKWHNEAYLQVNDYGWIDSPVSVIDTNYNAIATGTSVTPTESSQTIGGTNYMMEGAVTVNAIPSNYVGSAITSRTSSDLSASGATVTAPAGFYSSSASTSVQAGSAGTPTASKGAVSNHSITVTPFVTNSTGYINGGSITGTAVTVSASDVVSGTLSITSAGTKDVTTYASATVATGGATASASKGTVTNHSITVTPMVTRTAGYVTAGTANGTAVTVSASELVSGSETKTANGTYDVTNLASLVVNVSGGGGSGIGDLLSTKAIGAYSTSTTSSTNMNVSVAATNINAYDVLLVETSVDTKVANRHMATVGAAFIVNSTNAATKNAAVMANAKWNAKLSSSSVTQTTSSTTAYGIYPNSCTVTTTSNGTATFAMYARYNSSRSGTINGTYTARVYGIKLCDLIGG